MAGELLPAAWLADQRRQQQQTDRVAEAVDDVGAAVVPGDDEDAENLVHGLAQAVHKRGQPRSLMTDQGSAMKADEVRQGLARLGIVHEMTLPHSPYQNAKQESFWAQLEGRLIAMLAGGCEGLDRMGAGGGRSTRSLRGNGLRAGVPPFIIRYATLLKLSDYEHRLSLRNEC